MDKPTTIINVKNVPADAWEQAKRAANRRGQTMGEWLGNACIQQANREAGDGVIQPGQGANAPAIPGPIPLDYPEMTDMVKAMGTAGIAVQGRNQKLVNRALYERLRLAMPAKPRKKKVVIQHEGAGELPAIAHEPD